MEKLKDIQKKDELNPNNIKPDISPAINKTIKVDKVEYTTLINLNNELGLLNNNLAIFIRNIRKTKNELIKEADGKEKKINEYMDLLKKKYKIITPVTFDWQKGEFTLK